MDMDLLMDRAISSIFLGLSRRELPALLSHTKSMGQPEGRNE